MKDDLALRSIVHERVRIPITLNDGREHCERSALTTSTYLMSENGEGFSSVHIVSVVR